MPKILDSLRDDHRNLNKLLDVLDQQIAVFERGESPDYEAVTQILDYAHDYADRYHHPKEDLIYARLRDRKPEKAGAMHDLAADHAELADQTRRFAELMRAIAEGREMSRVRVLEIAKSYLAAHRRHLEMEEAWVFPDAETQLTAADWAEIEQAALSGPDPLFGPNADSHYDRLRALLG